MTVAIAAALGLWLGIIIGFVAGCSWSAVGEERAHRSGH
jgi:hypothetical protein